MNTILKRLGAESPTFFKKIQAIGITLGSAGAAIMAIPETTCAFPSAVTTMAGYFIAIGFVAAAVAKTTVADPAVLEKPEKKIL